MAEQVDLIEINLEDFITDTEKLSESIVDLEEANKSLRKDMKKTNEELEKEGKSRAGLSKEIALNSEELKDLKKQRTDAIKTAKQEIGSLDQLKDRQKKLIKERQALNISTKEGKDRLAEINTELRENQNAINDASEGFANFKGEMDGMNAATEELGGKMDGLRDSLDGVGGGAGNLIQGFKAFLSNPYVAILTGISAAVIAIGKAFKETRFGGQLLNKGMAELSGTGDALKRNFRDGIDTFREQFEQAKKNNGGFKALGKTVLNLSIFTKKGREEGQKSTRAFAENREAAVALRKALIDLNGAYIDIENELATQVVTLQGYADIQNLIADDDTRSFQERRKAALEAAEANEKGQAAAVKLSQERLNILDEEIKLGIVAGDLLREQDGTIRSLTANGIELEKAYTEASVAAIEASNQLTSTRLENQQRLAKINLDDFEQELDFLLDIAEATKSNNEQRIADDRIALGERKKILKETQKLIEDSFDDQLALYERDLGVQLERDKILELNNQEIFEYARGLGLSEIATNRLREVIIERRKAVQDLGVAQADLNEEEKTRNAEALERIREFENQQLLIQTESREERLALEIQWETEDYERKISNKLLLDSELQALEADHLDNLTKINDKYRKEQDSENKKAAAQEKSDKKRVGDFAVGIFDFVSQIRQENLAGQLAAAEGNDKKQEEIRKRFARREKLATIGQGVAKGALAVIQAFAQLGPIAGAIAAITVTATTAAQVGKIKSAKFKDGGAVRGFNVFGRSHAQGGVPLHIGNQYAGEIEGNEGVYVVNKRDNPEAVSQLSNINSVHGKPFAPRGYMQDGGEATTNNGVSVEDVLRVAREMPIQVSVVDINDSQARKVNVEQNGAV